MKSVVSAVIVCLLGFALPVHAQNAFSDNFEGGGIGWITSPPQNGVGWSVDNTPVIVAGGSANSGISSLNYNDGVDYENNGTNSGTATSININIGALGQPILTFWCNFETEDEDNGQENNFDVRTVQILNNGAPLMTVQLTNPDGPAPGGGGATDECDPSGTWHQHSFDLTGMPVDIQIRFRFDTIDDQFNLHDGWFVDDVVISENGTGGGVTGVGTGGTGPVDPGFSGERDPFGKESADSGEGREGVCAAGTASGLPIPIVGVLIVLLVMLRFRKEQPVRRQ